MTPSANVWRRQASSGRGHTPGSAPPTSSRMPIAWCSAPPCDAVATSMKIIVLTPHLAPDLAPTGAVITTLVEELAERGHRIEVITSLPWYKDHRIESGFEGRLARREDTPWGSVLRLHPFPTEDKTDIVRRAMSFAGFTALAAAKGRRGERADVVLAVSPPLTLGLAGHSIAKARKASLVFNIQDVFPDVAIELGALK